MPSELFQSNFGASYCLINTGHHWTWHWLISIAEGKYIGLDTTSGDTYFWTRGKAPSAPCTLSNCCPKASNTKKGWGQYHHTVNIIDVHTVEEMSRLYCCHQLVQEGICPTVHVFLLQHHLDTCYNTCRSCFVLLVATLHTQLAERCSTQYDMMSAEYFKDGCGQHLPAATVQWILKIYQFSFGTIQQYLLTFCSLQRIPAPCIDQGLLAWYKLKKRAPKLPI